MTKAEMESDARLYAECMQHVRAALEQRTHNDAVTLALQAWPHVDGMIQYARKYEKREVSSVEAFDVVLQHAPLLFRTDCLNALSSLLKEKRRIDGATSDNIAGKLQRASEVLARAHRLWNLLEESGDVVERELPDRIGGDVAEWRRLASLWEEMGVLRRMPHAGAVRSRLATRMAEPWRAKCASCGAVATAEKRRFLDTHRCSNCNSESSFVLLEAADEAPTQG